MPIEDRDWYRGKHPSACTCVRCTSRRPKIKWKSSDSYVPRNKQNKRYTKKGRSGMLRIPVGLFGLWLIVLAAHGLHIHFSWWEALWAAASGDKLFLTIGVPSPLDSWVFWMSNKGFQSWVIPLLVGMGGVYLVFVTSLFDYCTGILRRLRLW